MERLRRRTDFRAAATGVRASGAAFALQARRRAEDGPARVGFTVSRQVGNAVERNRVRRRLRELVKTTGGSALRTGHDYLLIGRRTALVAPFGDMIDEFARALRRVHAARQAPSGGAGSTTVPSLHEAEPPPELGLKPRSAAKSTE